MNTALAELYVKISMTDSVEAKNELVHLFLQPMLEAIDMKPIPTIVAYTAFLRWVARI